MILGYAVVYMRGVSNESNAKSSGRGIYQNRLLSGGSPLAIRSITMLDVRLENYGRLQNT